MRRAIAITLTAFLFQGCLAAGVGYAVGKTSNDDTIVVCEDEPTFAKAKDKLREDAVREQAHWPLKQGYHVQVREQSTVYLRGDERTVVHVEVEWPSNVEGEQYWTFPAVLCVR